MVLKRSYSDELPFTRPAWGGDTEVVQQPRKISTFINSLIAVGLIVERVIEGDFNPELASEEDMQSDQWYSVARAQMMPTTLIVKARKPVVLQKNP